MLERLSQSGVKLKPLSNNVTLDSQLTSRIFCQKSFGVFHRD